MDFFARLTEQAKDLWARPTGKWLVGIVGLFIIFIGAASIFYARPTYVSLGRFDGEDAGRVVAALQDARIEPRVSGTTVSVKENDRYQAQLILTQLNLDPAGAVWTYQSWANTSSWMSTSYDKRIEWREQTEHNLSRAIRALSMVENARVQLTIPMTERLYSRDETPPKAAVIVQPKQGQTLSRQNVESIMLIVAGAVEKLDPKSVEVVDASRGIVVSTNAFVDTAEDVNGTRMATDLLGIQQKYQEHWQRELTASLEKVIGVGNVSVIVNPVINWERVIKESVEYTPVDGTNAGVVLSEERHTESSEGTQSGTGGLAGAAPNVEGAGPTYQVGNPALGALTAETERRILNYLVSSTVTRSDKPNGVIEELSVGVMVNSRYVDAASEASIAATVSAALGALAPSVSVAALPFDTTLTDLLNQPPLEAPASPIPWNGVFAVLGVLLAFGAVYFILQALRNRRQVFEPAFVGPEAVLMGGIPINDFDLTAAAKDPDERRLPETAEELAHMAPEEIALLGDEFLQQLGVDPAKVRMKEKVEKIARGNPEMVANLIKAWIVDE